jgi:ubiquinone/menaquinone biosynthesis C-methylase UbiE
MRARLSRTLLGLAHLKRGESVLDVGCGTGTLAIAARRHVGLAGDVRGIDASPEKMLARAERKAKKAGSPNQWFEDIMSPALWRGAPSHKGRLTWPR